MLSLVKAEWLKLNHNVVLGVVIIVMAVVSFWVSGLLYGRLPEMMGDSLATMGADQSIISKGEYVFRKSMSDSGLTAWLSMVFAALFIGLEYENRTFNDAIFAGHSRERIFAVKSCEYFLIACCVSFIFPLVSCLRYSLGWFGTLSIEDVQYVLRCIGLRVVLDVSLFSIISISTYAFRDLIRSMIFNVIFTIIFSQLLNVKYALETDSFLYQLIQLFPPIQVAYVMERDISTGIVMNVLYTGIVSIGVSSIVSYMLFNRSDLE